MRPIGNLGDEKLARQFSDYLVVRGIDHLVEPANDGGWIIWIEEEEQVGPAHALLERFQANSTDPEFQIARDAARLRAEAEKEARLESKRSRAMVRDVRTDWHLRSTAFKLPVTGGLILLSVAVALI